MSYAIVLQDFPNLPADAKADAEKRFKRALEKALGEDVMPIFKAFSDASDAGPDALSRDDLLLANRWPKAYDLAKTAGFRDLGTADEAFFELRTR